MSLNLYLTTIRLIQLLVNLLISSLSLPLIRRLLRSLAILILAAIRLAVGLRLCCSKTRYR